MNREAAILAAMPKATLAEQRLLAQELEAIRSSRRTAAQQDREVDLANAVIRDTLTPVLPHTRHTAATDWIGEVAAPTVNDRQLHAQAKAEATVWFKRTASFVREDRDEFTEQARGAARQWAGQFGFQASAAREAFVSQALHLAGFRRQAAFGSEEEETRSVRCEYCDKKLTRSEQNYGGFVDACAECREGVDDDEKTASLRPKQAGPLFPGPGAEIYRNDAGEVTGWDDGSYEPDPYDSYDDDRGGSDDDAQWENGYEAGQDDFRTDRATRVEKDRYGFSHEGGEVDRVWLNGYAEGYQNAGGDEKDIEFIFKNASRHGSFRRQAAGSYAQYGWIIDKSYIEDDNVDNWGKPAFAVSDEVIGPRNIHPKVEQYLKSGKGAAFKLYDDDDMLYYSGRWVEDAVAAGLMSESEGEGNYGGNPLEDYGTPNAGAAYMTNGRGGRGNSIIGSFRRQAEDGFADVVEQTPQSGHIVGWDLSEGYNDEPDELGLSADAGYRFAADNSESTVDCWQCGMPFKTKGGGRGTSEEDYVCSDCKGKKKESSLTRTAARPIYEIAADIRRNWKNVGFAAKPYLDAMMQLNSINDMYYSDPADMIVRYFLGNTRGWTGERAKELKAELKAMLSGKSSSLTRTAASWVSGSGSSPWGAVQMRRDSQSNPGVFQVSTAGHGGVYVPEKYLPMIPTDVQNIMGAKWSGSANWYEEDGGVNAPLAYLPGLAEEWYPEFSQAKALAEVEKTMMDESGVTASFRHRTAGMRYMTPDEVARYEAGEYFPSAVRDEMGVMFSTPDVDMGDYGLNEDDDIATVYATRRKAASIRRIAVSETDAREALDRVLEENFAYDEEYGSFDYEKALQAILSGEVTPDDNDGLIRDEATALAFGAFMSDGPWWKTASGRTAFRRSAATNECGKRNPYGDKWVDPVCHREKGHSGSCVGLDASGGRSGFTTRRSQSDYYDPKPRTYASRRTADQGFGPATDNQSGQAETELSMVTVDSATESSNLGWIEEAPEAYEMADSSELGPFDASLRRAMAALESEVRDAVREVAQQNGSQAAGFDEDAAVKAILDGKVTPDYNDGFIDANDEAMAMAMGAFMSNGPWWKTASRTAKSKYGECSQTRKFPDGRMMKCTRAAISEGGKCKLHTLAPNASRKTAAEAFPKVTDAEAQKFVDIAKTIGYTISRDEAYDILLLSGGFKEAMDTANIVESVYNDVRGYGELPPEAGYGVSMLIETTDYLAWVHDFDSEDRTLDECKKMLGMLRTEPQKKSMRWYINYKFGVTASRKTAMPSPAEVGVSVGDIFYNSWGYDQTNVDFYEVIRLTGQGVEVQPINSRVVSSGQGSESVVPIPGSVREFDVITGIDRNDKKTKVCRLRDYGGSYGPSIVLSRDHSASKWDGTPKHQTDAYSGH